MVYLTRRERFNAAHRLFNEAWSTQKNFEIFGQCANTNYHGHNFELFVTVKGKPNEDTGLIINAKALSQLIREHITKKVDHKNLNLDVDFLNELIPSIENLAIAFWEQLEPHLKDCQLHCVKIIETENIFVEYFGKYTKQELYDEKSTLVIKDSYKTILKNIGEDEDRDGLLKTPERAAKAMQFFTHGYDVDAAGILTAALFDDDCQDMVIVRDIEVYSLCEHHMIPFFGKAHIAYIPDGKIVGLSKIPRVVDVFARRLQVQEKLTRQVLNCIQDVLNPMGVAVVMECQHLCMMMRGVEKQNSITATSGFTGAFTKMKTRTEFINLISRKIN